MSRLFLISDSLGLPRELIPIESVWSSRIISEFKYDYDIFTYLKRALNTEDLLLMKDDIFKLSNPSVAIVQVGIVDCVRRALPRWFLNFVLYIPILSKILRRIVKNNHFFLTRLFKVYIVKPNKFRKNIQTLIQISEEMKIQLAIIMIAKPGDYLKKTIFDVENDILRYNKILESEISNCSNVRILNPYLNQNVAKYILSEDGHHLTIDGNDLVYNTVKNYLLSLNKT